MATRSQGREEMSTALRKMATRSQGREEMSTTTTQSCDSNEVEPTVPPHKNRDDAGIILIANVLALCNLWLLLKGGESLTFFVFASSVIITTLLPRHPDRGLEKNCNAAWVKLVVSAIFSAGAFCFESRLAEKLGAVVLVYLIASPFLDTTVVRHYST